MNQIKKAIEQCQEELNKIGIDNVGKQHELVELMQAYEALEFVWRQVNKACLYN